MTTHQVYSVEDWKKLLSREPQVSGVISLMADLTFKSQPQPLVLFEGVIFNGKNHTISVQYPDGCGLFNLSGGKVHNLMVDGGGHKLKSGESLFSCYSSRNTSQYGHFVNCSALNTRLNTNGGGIGCYQFGNVDKVSTFVNCYSNVELGACSGGIVGRYSKNSVIHLCYFDGVCGGLRSGGIAGDGSGFLGTSVSIQSCYSHFDVSQSNAAAICGGTSKDSTVSISDCFSTGELSGHECSGMIGTIHDTGKVTILNCYVTGDIIFEGGAFVSTIGANSKDVAVDIRNSYYCGTPKDGATVISKFNGLGKCTVTDTFLNLGKTKNSGSRNVDLIRVYNDLQLIDDGRLPTKWMPGIWMALDGQYPTLCSFSNQHVWDGSYHHHTDSPKFKKVVAVEPEPAQIESQETEVESAKETVRTQTVSEPPDTSPVVKVTSEVTSEVTSDPAIVTPIVTVVEAPHIPAVAASSYCHDHHEYQKGSRIRYINVPVQEGIISRPRPMGVKDSFVVRWLAGPLHKDGEQIAYFAAKCKVFELSL